MINFFESVTMSPRGEAMDIISLDFAHDPKPARVVFASKILNWISDRCDNGQEAVNGSSPRPG